MTALDTADGFASVVDRLVDELGFRLELITPADDPRRAVLRRGDALVDVSRDGERSPRDEPMRVPALEPALVITNGGEDGWNDGRAGMRYRDLIPCRLGGRYIASNIEVCDGGEVPDLVHHHAIRLQLIVCQTGWVDVVYQDQGDPFRMHAGDVVLQPPHIRHRVLASSAGARVVEVGCPAEHDTLFDHELTLPNTSIDRTRRWGGQRFVHHIATKADWEPIDPSQPAGGARRQATGVAAATEGLVAVAFIRLSQGDRYHHDGAHAEFGFHAVLHGAVDVSVNGTSHRLDTGGAITTPPGTGCDIVALGDAHLVHVQV